MNPSFHIENLLSFHPYSELTDELKQQALAHVKVKQYQKGALIFQRGKISPYMYYLLDGRLDLINANFAARSIVPDDYKSFMEAQTSPSKESAVAKDTSTFLVVEKDYLDLLLMWNSQAKEDAAKKAGEAKANVTFDDESDWMSGLIDSPLLANIPPAHLQQLFARFELLEMKKGTPIIRQGEKGEYFYVVRQGSVHVSSMNGHLDITLSQGQFFGEESLIAETPRNASVIPLEDGWLMRLNKDDFKALLEEPVINYMSYEELIQYAADNHELQILDVRLGAEYKYQHLPGSLNAPLQKLRKRLSTLSKSCLYLITSDAGRRAEVAAHLMCQAGLRAVILKDVEAHYIVPPSHRKGDKDTLTMPGTMAG